MHHGSQLGPLTLQQLAQRRLRQSEYFEELVLLGECDRAGRQAGVEAPELEEALDYLREAGARAHARGALHESVERYGEALRLLSRLPASSDNLRRAIVRVVNATFEARDPKWWGEASATASDFPDLRYELDPATAFLRYHVSESWTLSVRYSFERFKQVDFRTDGLQPSTGADIFLGSDPEDYRASYFTLTLAFRPWVPGLRRPLF